MGAIKGYPDQRKAITSSSEYVTVNPVKDRQHALDVVAHNAVTAVATGDTVEALSTASQIVATGHSAQRGDVIRFTSGALSPRDVHVESVDASTIYLTEELPSIPSPGDTFDIMRFTYQTTTGTGATSTQLEFIRDGSGQIVTEDTVTPANNRPLPVKLLDVTGDINITANDLNVQLGHTGANPDSVQIGDGTDVLGINADGSVVSRISDGTDTLAIQADGSITTRISDGTDSLAINADGSLNVTDNGGSITVDDGGSTLSIDDGGASLTVDGSVSVSNFPASQTVDDGGSTLSIDDGGSSITVDGTVSQGTSAASFQALGTLQGTALTGTYATLITASADSVVVALLNRCDEAITISLDNGVTDHFTFEPGESFSLDLGASGRHLASGTVIQVKHAGVVPTSGSIRATLVS